MFRTPVDGFFPDFLRAQHMVRVIEGKIIQIILLHEKFLQFDWLRAVVFHLNLKYLHVKITYDGNPGEIDFGSSQRGFELSGVDCTYIGVVFCPFWSLNSAAIFLVDKLGNTRFVLIQTVDMHSFSLGNRASYSNLKARALS